MARSKQQVEAFNEAIERAAQIAAAPCAVTPSGGRIATAKD